LSEVGCVTARLRLDHRIVAARRCHSLIEFLLRWSWTGRFAASSVGRRDIGMFRIVVNA
jgi:hypothetical protein